jgi:integrase
MRYRKSPFTLHTRKTKDGARVWYYQTYDSEGNRTNARSTGIGFANEANRKRTMQQAEELCWQLYKDGKLVPASTKDVTLEAFSEQRRWWEYGRCEYIAQKLARSPEGRPAITERYANDAWSILHNYILPEHGNQKLSRITSGDLEKLLFKWSKQSSPKTANNRRAVYSTMLSEAARLGLIEENPWGKVRSLTAAKHAWGSLTLAEVARLLDPESWHEKWSSHLYYTAVAMAYFTGMRIGEVLGLQVSDIREGWVRIQHSWNDKQNKIGQTKDKEPRDVPIPDFLTEHLEPYRGHEGFAFSLTGGVTPLGKNTLPKALQSALAAIGISREEQKERRIVFHSGRRWFNTYLYTNGVATSIVQRLTGHDSQAMTDHYTDLHVEDLGEVARLQSEVFSKASKDQQLASSA